MSHLIGLDGQPLSQRETRTVVNKQQQALTLYTLAFQAFMQLTLLGRLRWLVFGSRAFKPRNVALLEQIQKEAAEMRKKRQASA